MVSKLYYLPPLALEEGYTQGEQILEQCDWYQNSGVKGKHNCSLFVRLVTERTNKISFVIVVKGGEKFRCFHQFRCCRQCQSERLLTNLGYSCH